MNNESYVVINGKKAELTDEQLKALGIEAKKRKIFLIERKSKHIILLIQTAQ